MPHINQIVGHTSVESVRELEEQGFRGERYVVCDTFSTDFDFRPLGDGSILLVEERDAKVRRLIILVRASLTDSFLFDDKKLEEAAGSTALSDYARLLETGCATKSKYTGHNCDGIAWGPESEILPPVTGRSMEFRGGF